MRKYLRESHVQKVCKYENNSIIFDSRFDSGAFARIDQIGRTNFIVYAAPDCYGTHNENNFRSWFHFSVTATEGVELNLIIRGISVTPKLFKEGMRPVFRYGSHKKWKRLKGEFNFRQSPDTTVEISFAHIFDKRPVFYAFTYPFSYTESQDLMT